MKVIVQNMRQNYSLDDPRRIKDPKTILARRALSVLGGVLGAIACVLGTGLFHLSGGAFKVAAGAMCLYTNARLYWEGWKEEQELIRSGCTDPQKLQNAQYKKIKGAAGFASSFTYIGYFALAVAVGVCPPIILLGVLAGAMSIGCFFLEQPGAQEKFYKAKADIERIGVINWIRGNDREVELVNNLRYGV